MNENFKKVAEIKIKKICSGINGLRNVAYVRPRVPPIIDLRHSS